MSDYEDNLMTRRIRMLTKQQVRLHMFHLSLQVLLGWAQVASNQTRRLRLRMVEFIPAIPTTDCGCSQFFESAALSESNVETTTSISSTSIAPEQTHYDLRILDTYISEFCIPRKPVYDTPDIDVTTFINAFGNRYTRFNRDCVFKYFAAGPKLYNYYIYLAELGKFTLGLERKLEFVADGGSRVTSSSSTPTSDAIFSTSSDTTSSQDTSPANRPTRTITITRVFTTTFSDGRTTTISTVVETGVLRTDTPQQLGGLGRNTGAIAGIAVAVTLAVIFVIFLLFYGCRRYRARQNFDRGSIDILARAREVWRPPIDGDDDDVSYLRGHNSLNRRQTLGSQEHSGEGGYIGQGSSGDHLSGEGGGAGSAESTNIGMASAMHPTFGGQPYMPNMTQTMGDPFARPAPVVLPAHSANDGHAAEGAKQYWWGINDPQAARDIGGRRSETSENGVPQMASRSAVSLTVVGGSGSSGGHGSGSSHGKSGAIKAKRNSMNGPRPMPKSEGRRHSSTPPSAFVGSLREPAYDCERQEQSDRNSVKGFLNRLRTTSHRVSTQSIATLRGTPAPQPRATTDDTSFLPPPGVYSPSLLNPPQALLRFPRGVTGNGYTSLSPPLPQMSSAGYDLHPPSFPWPTMTLPSAPSPVPTDASSMVEGLLHPRLGALDTAQQASTASLRDHEDYTRPINGLVNNHLRSTTTFDTLNSEEGGPMIAS
ncbi:hypothetical protein JR316_0010261 [Psilocybe cubensis]|uniref:Uncharacterized protein n=2 Tax=Psilocybe cubensis TaxID=181762 RepID=A0ACB8GSR0_PSICU|nr:hypothetical protein JR316_0010261 [Psilocybe cubensis]KAH9478025.1 hypothetical protein JR316_0010261 [Psilocybe cubensis]